MLLLLLTNIIWGIQPWASPGGAQHLCSLSSRNHYQCHGGIQPSNVWQIVTPTQVQVDCRTSKYTVVVGNEQEVYYKMRSYMLTKRGAVCSGQGSPCSFLLSPFKTVTVLIQSRDECKLEASRTYDFMRLAVITAGLLLLLCAARLARSVVFRMAAGTCFLTTTSLIIVAWFVLFRMKPRTVAGMGIVGLGTWNWLGSAADGLIISGRHMLHQNLLVIYLIVAVPIAIAVTYLFDDVSNVKLRHVVQGSFHMCGALFIMSACFPHWKLGLAIVTAAACVLTANILLRIMTWTCQLPLTVVNALARLIWISSKASGTKDRHGMRRGTMKATSTSAGGNQNSPSDADSDTSGDGSSRAQSHKKNQDQKKQGRHSDNDDYEDDDSEGSDGSEEGEAKDSSTTNFTMHTLSPEEQGLMRKLKLIFNPIDGEVIRVGGEAYSCLVQLGFTHDVDLWMMRAPSRKR